VTELLSVATHPRDRQAFDAARRRLWGTALAGGRASSFDPFDHFYNAVGETFEKLYDCYNPDDSDTILRLLKEMVGFFDRCNAQLFLKALAGLQDGFLPWFRDGKRLLTSQSSAVLAMVSTVCHVWVCHTLTVVDKIPMGQNWDSRRRDGAPRSAARVSRALLLCFVRLFAPKYRECWRLLVE